MLLFLGIFSKKTKAQIKNVSSKIDLTKIDGTQVQSEESAQGKKDNEIFEMKIARLNSIAFITMFLFISLSYASIFGSL
jgi:hypothetical protein